MSNWSWSGAISGGITGAMYGSTTTNPYGAVIGFVVGFIIGGLLGVAFPPPDIPRPGTPNQEQLQYTTNVIGSPLYELLGTAKMVGNFLAIGGEYAVAVTQKVPSGGKGGGGGHNHQTVGYNYYATFVEGICKGPVDSLLAVYSDNDDLLWSGELNRPISGGQSTITLAGVGSMTFYFGTDDHVQNATVAGIVGSSLNSPYRNLCYAVFNNCFIGTYNRVSTFKFVVRKTPAINFNANHIIDVLDYNPAHAIWYILHDMVGLPEEWLDANDFSDVANVLNSESRGISILFDTQTEALSYIQNILTHVDAVIRYGNDGKFHPKLIRNDYDPNYLELIDESIILEPPQYTRRAWIDTLNEIKVQYSKLSRPDTGEWQTTCTFNEPYVKSLAVYNGKLYIGTGSAPGAGNVYVYDGYTCTLAFATGNYCVEALYVFDNYLWAGCSYDGKLYHFDGATWEQEDRPYNPNPGNAPFPLPPLPIFGYIFSINQDHNQLEIGVTDGTGNGQIYICMNDVWYNERGYSAEILDFETGNILSLYNFNSDLFAGGGGSYGPPFTGGKIWRKLDNFTLTGFDYNNIDQINSFCAYDGRIYAGVQRVVPPYNDLYGEVWVSDSGNTWSLAFTPPVRTFVIPSMAVYNGRLYASTCGGLDEPNDEVIYSFDGINWNVSHDTGCYNAMVVYNGNLYAGGAHELASYFDYNAVSNFKKEISAPCALDIGNKNIQERLVSKTVDLLLFTLNRNAVWAAFNILQKLSYPFATITLSASRDAFRYEVGDCFKFSWADYGVSNVVCRVAQVQEEGPESENITISAIEDVFSITSAVADFTTPISYIPPASDYTTLPFTRQKVVEAPYTLSGEEINILSVAGRRTNTDLGYYLYMSVDGGNSYSLMSVIGNIVPFGTLDDDYTEDTYTIDTEVGFNITALNDDINRVETTTWANVFSGQNNTALLGDEMISFQSITPVSGTLYYLNGIVRGRFGSEKVTHLEGEGLYFINQDITLVTNSEVLVGAQRKFKLVPHNARAVGFIADAQVQDLTITGVAFTPYRPVNFTANGGSFAARYDTDIVLEWAARVRAAGAGYGIPGVVLPTNTREGYFEIEVYVSSILVRTETAINAETWTYTSTMNTTDNGTLASEITFKILNYILTNTITYESTQTTVVCNKN